MSRAWRPRLLIAGSEIDRTAMSTVIDPRTGTAALEVPVATLEHVELALRAARAAAPGWAALGFEQRSAHLAEIARCVSSARDRLTTIVERETGRTREEAALEIDVFSYIIDRQIPVRPRDEQLESTGERSARLEYCPLGIVAAIGAWNYPLVMIAQKIAAPLHAGNTVIYKPSPFAPASAVLLAELVDELLPPGVLTVLPGGAEVGAALVRDARVAKISFTGSTRTGRRVMADAAPTLKRLTLELGWNDAAIVLEDADIERDGPRIWQKAFFNAGQTCTAIKRLLIHERVADRLIAILRRLCGERSVQPVQNAAQLHLVEEMVADAVSRGATVLAGGQRERKPGYWFPATLLAGVAPGMRIWDEECFGPVLPVRVFADEAEAIALANESSSAGRA